jgi:dipeptidyl-peptidase 4
MTGVEHPSDGPTGAPTHLSVASDGSRVIFLRGVDSAAVALWVHDVASGAERMVTGPGVIGPGAVDPGAVDPGAGGATGATSRYATSRYAIDAGGTTAVFTSGGRIMRADLATGTVRPVPGTRPAVDPRPDPTGRWIAYRSGGTLRVAGPGGDALLAGEPDSGGSRPLVTWGSGGGWWWAPDGRAVLATRSDLRLRRREVSLHLLELDGGWVDVHWDRETYPYLAAVCWSDHGSPVVAVLRRSQQHGLVLAADPRTGETQVHAELADPRWVMPVPGTPRHLADGRVLIGGELAHDGYDARCLFADGTLLTPPSLYVRRVVGRLPGTTELLVEATSGEPTEQHLYRVGTSVGAAGIDARRITTAPGWHRAEVGGETLAIGSESLDHPGPRWTVWRAGRQVGELVAAASRPVMTNRPAVTCRPAAAPRPVLQRVTDRRLSTGVLYPSTQIAGRQLPVLLEVPDIHPTTGSFRQAVRAVRACWLPRQWWADAGFAVVTVDHRGTPGVAPSFEKVIHKRLADLALADLVDALSALADKHADLDLDRVAIRGHGAGGWLAALAALRRPETFRCAVVEAPVVDWQQEDPVVAERYLGLPDDGPEVYEHHSLLAAAGKPPGPGPVAPLLLVPDADTAATVRRLAATLVTAGRPHAILPSDGPGDATSTRVAELDFLRRRLRLMSPADA